MLSVRRLSRLLGPDACIASAPARRRDAPIGGSVLAGLTHTLRSPYLLNISLYILLYSITSTFLYFQQAGIAATSLPDRGARTQFFARSIWS